MIANHPRRESLIAELHARPWQRLTAPVEALHLALKVPRRAIERDRAADETHLALLLRLWGQAAPPTGVAHWRADHGALRLRWERHAEFVSYTLFRPLTEGAALTLPLADPWADFPVEWQAAAPGAVVVAARMLVLPMTPAHRAATTVLPDGFESLFDAESLAGAVISDGDLRLWSDFRLPEDGFMRFLLLADPQIKRRKLGRVVQRIFELETYRSMALLTLPEARSLSVRLGQVDQELAALTSDLAADGVGRGDAEALTTLTRLSATLEAEAARLGFRFGGTRAYATLVAERVAALRETRIPGLQTIGEFLNRRFDPAIRTCASVEGRLEALSARATRAADLLRTRVDVALAAQNQRLLQSMDRRAALQLRLQETVEGLSVVAISYYALGLAAYLAEPLAQAAGLGSKYVKAALVPLVVGVVWFFLRRMKRRLHHAQQDGSQQDQP